MGDLSYFQRHVVNRIQFAAVGSEVVVESEWEREQAERIIHVTRPFDEITVRVERRENYDGDSRIIDLAN